MKKLLKISLLVALFMALWTITSKAATVDYTVNQNGSIGVTITCTGDIDDAAKTVFEGAGYTVNVSEKTATRTYDNARQAPKYKYFEFEDICVATPLEMTVGNIRTLTSPSTITNTTDPDVVEIQNGNKYVAKAVGTSTITINANNSDHPNEIYEQRITVVAESSDSEDSTDSSLTATYEGNKFVVSGLPSGSYGYFVDTSASTAYDSSITDYLLKDENGKYVSAGTTNQMLELNQDLYAHIVDRSNPLSYTKYADVKITRPALNDYNNFSSLSCASFELYQLLFDLPYNVQHDSVARTIHFKIGKITDNSILRSIKNGEGSGFANLKEFAKNDSNALYDKTVTANTNNGYRNDGSILNGKDLVDKGYYYLYAFVDSEDGKYVPVESITITQASVYPDQDYHWFMFFYGSGQFNFDGIADATTPDSSSGEQTPSKLPATGEKAIVFVLIGVAVVAVVILRKKATKF